MAETADKKPRARKAKPAEAPPAPPPVSVSRRRAVLRWAARILGGIAAFYAVLILLFSFVPPPINLYQLSRKLAAGRDREGLGAAGGDRPVMARAAVAAEDANFCNHWGFDMAAIREAVERGRQPRRQHDQPAGHQERLPVAGPQLAAQGDGGGADAGGRTGLVEAADPRGLPERGRVRDRRLWRAGGGAALLSASMRRT
jgi:hypothetical protein